MRRKAKKVQSDPFAFSKQVTSETFSFLIEIYDFKPLISTSPLSVSLSMGTRRLE